MKTKNAISVKEIILEHLWIALGVAILATSVFLFFRPHNLVLGGISGLGIILEYLSSKHWSFQIPLWLTNLVFNVVLSLIALKVMGFRFLLKTIYGFLCLTLFFFLLEFTPQGFMEFFYTIPLIISSMIGAIVAGIGIGIFFLKDAGTGGTVLIAQLISHRFKKLPVATSLMFADWSIILMGIFVFGIERSVYGMVAIYISTKVIEQTMKFLTKFRERRAA
ncbi:MAG: YitT family protein [Defluviitaleaceae bacterium]|nr:YitT family protein [Defluviitaleaceae bacterium]